MASKAAARAPQLQEAVSKMKAGDDSLYRALVGGRFVAEYMASMPDPYSKMSHSMGRTRKFSNPLFMTPAGLLHGFPEKDEDLFVELDQALDAIRRMAHPGTGPLWRVRSTTLAAELKSKRFLRWHNEVKNAPGAGYVEPRRSLEEKADIFARSGMAGLKATYTHAHAFRTLRRIRDEIDPNARSEPSMGPGAKTDSSRFVD